MGSKPRFRVVLHEDGEKIIVELLSEGGSAGDQSEDLDPLDSVICSGCMTCGSLIETEPDAERTWCENCGKVRKVFNPIDNLYDTIP